MKTLLLALVTLLVPAGQSNWSLTIDDKDTPAGAVCEAVPYPGWWIIACFSKLPDGTIKVSIIRERLACGEFTWTDGHKSIECWTIALGVY